MLPDPLRPRPRRVLATLALLIALALLTLLALPAAAQQAPADDEARPGELTFDRIFDRDGRGAVPGGFTWSPDGTVVAYTYDDGDGRALWTLAPGDGEPRKLLSELGEDDETAEDGEEDGEEETGENGEDDAATDAAAHGEASEAAAENGRRGLSFGTGFEWTPDGGHLLVSHGGDLWLVAAAEGAARRLPDSPDEAEEQAALSPAGDRVAFVRDFDLHLLDLESGEITALTDDGEENEILNGTTDWVYWEEIWGRRSSGFWWSPDGSRIAYYRFDEEPVGTYPLVDFTQIPYPTVEEQKYPKAGTDNPRVKLGVLDLESGATTWLDTGDDPTAYLARVDWKPDGSGIAVQRLNREQDRLDVLLCAPEDGSCDTLHTETWPTWVNLTDDFTWLDDGRFLWTSERSGWRHLYLHAADGGEERRLTSGDWAVSEVLAVDETRDRVVFQSHPPGPLGAKDRRVAAVGLGGGEITVLTEGEGWHGGEVSPVSGLWVHGWSDSETPNRVVVRDAGGAEVAALPTRPPAYDPAALPHYRYLLIDGPDGETLPARILEPAERGAGGGHPAIMYHYGGPGSQVVANRWDGRGRDLWHKMMAQRGYAVLSVDNGASVFFGKHGEDRQHRRFGPLNLKAQEAGVAYLASLGWVNADRVGLWGWSGGGTTTLYCLFGSPGTWAAGMSGAPVTDWRLYDTIWTERYLDHPDDNAEGYEQSSPLTHAAALEDRLLVVHGTGDDNVHPQNTLALANALIEAGKPFEDAIYPRQKHGFHPPTDRHFYERMTRFFEQALGEEAEGQAQD